MPLPGRHDYPVEPAPATYSAERCTCSHPYADHARGKRCRSSDGYGEACGCASFDELRMVDDSVPQVDRSEWPWLSDLTTS